MRTAVDGYGMSPIPAVTIAKGSDHSGKHSCTGGWWTPQKLEWYERAAQCSDFHERLAAEVASLIPRGKSILEVGCGLGYMTRALASMGYDVFGIDNDAAAIDKALELSCTADEEAPRLAMEDYRTSQRKADVVLSVFCGRIDEEGIGYFERLAGERIIYIVSKHRFNNLRQDRSPGICRYLEQSGHRFSHKELTLRFDQPLLSLEEASLFFGIQHGNEELKATPSDGPYPYVFENEKRMTLFDIETRGKQKLPKEV